MKRTLYLSEENVHARCSTVRRNSPKIKSLCLPFHSQEWSMSNFPCGLTRNITSHSGENLAFHSQDDYTTNSHYLTHTLLSKRSGEYISTSAIGSQHNKLSGWNLWRLSRRMGTSLLTSLRDTSGFSNATPKNPWLFEPAFNVVNEVFKLTTNSKDQGTFSGRDMKR